MTMPSHSPGPWTHGTDDKADCILDANGQHIICFGHDYDDYGGFFVTLPRQTNRQAKEIAVTEANIELVRSAPEMVQAILALRDIVQDHEDAYGPLPWMQKVLTDTESYERWRQ